MPLTGIPFLLTRISFERIQRWFSVELYTHILVFARRLVALLRARQLPELPEKDLRTASAKYVRVGKVSISVDYTSCDKPF